MHNPKHCIVDWNGRRRLLENTNRFSSCDVMLPELSLSYGNSMSLETPECEAHGGSSNARGKRPPAVEINSFSSYPKNTDLRTNIYFAPERLLGYSTDTSCTS